MGEAREGENQCCSLICVTEEREREREVLTFLCRL